MAAGFREFGTEQFAHGAVFVRSTGAVVVEPPLRLRMRRAAMACDFERICAWRRHSCRPQFLDWLAAARPRLCPELESQVRSEVRNGVMVPASAILSATGPLAATVRPDRKRALVLTTPACRRRVTRARSSLPIRSTKAARAPDRPAAPPHRSAQQFASPHSKSETGPRLGYAAAVDVS